MTFEYEASTQSLDIKQCINSDKVQYVRRMDFSDIYGLICLST